MVLLQSLSKKVNLLVLLLGIIAIIVLVPKKQLYYDEPFSVMCAKGITSINYFELNKLNGGKFITTEQMNAENTLYYAYHGGDSLYYISLHFYTLLFGNTLNSYLSMSILFSVLSLMAFYYLCRTVMGNTLFSAVAMVLFLTHMIIVGSLYSIRPYSLGLFLTILSGIFFFRYLFEKNSAKNMFLLVLFSVLAILTHYFCLYVVFVYGVMLLYNERLKLFSKGNLLAMAGPALLLVLYFATHFGLVKGYGNFQHYTKEIHKTAPTLGGIFLLTLKNIAVTFNAIFPVVRDTAAVAVGSFLLVIGLVISGGRLISNARERSKFYYLFLLGVISSIFLSVVYLISKNFMLFSYRYFLFSIPFCCLFIVAFLKATYEHPGIKSPLKWGTMAFLIVPGLYIYARAFNTYPGMPCNHLVVVDRIMKNDADRIEVPELLDAVMIHCFLPSDKHLTYYIKPDIDGLIVTKEGKATSYPLLRETGIMALYGNVVEEQEKSKQRSTD